MNAARKLVNVLPRRALARLLEGSPRRPAHSVSTDQMRRRLCAELELDLCALLNLAVRDELDAMADAANLESCDERPNIGELRARLWEWGAALEAGEAQVRGTELQRVPVVLRGKLVHMRAGSGLAPVIRQVPRPIASPVPVRPAAQEPESIDELLDNADAIVGMRLGAAGRDKGAFGTRIAELLGVKENYLAEPDWRGEVEIKTVPVVRDTSGWWRVKEDPAIAMEDVDPMTKLLRVLWVARVADAPDSPILSWYYQECDARVRELAGRALHTRPKGGAGATTRGWYLHKGFFADSGFLRSLNG